ncbi:MAG TPA: SURF1 family cytochrome oxidase biogenesis protein, partial [Pseudoxanthomonas sp.]|nr:SURF1 family cytochrome oxidase biogenesis protein [Pseudoxanthomonas sp.]
MTPAAADGDPGRGPRGPLALALLAAAFAAGLVLFLALGVWQLQRMAWKHDLVARVESRIHAPAAPAPDAAAWEAAAPRDHEYRRVAVRGRWLAGHDTLVQAVTEIGPGRWLLRPLQRDGGGIVLVNLGFVPEGFQAPPPAPGPAEATGLLRLDEPGGGFLRRNDPAAGRWYSRDVAAIARHRGLD